MGAAVKLKVLSLLAIVPALVRAQPPSTAAQPTYAVGQRWEYDAIHYRYVVEVVSAGLKVPFSFAFLPDGRAVLSDRGELNLALVDMNTGERTPLSGGPAVFDSVDCGLLDVAVHPDYVRTGWIYYAFTERGDVGITTVVERARIRGPQLIDRQRLFAAFPAIDNIHHPGARLLLVDGYVYITLGERDLGQLAQELWTDHGKIIRLHDDGRVPADNPFVGRRGARPEIWSIGHRNPHGLTLHPETRELWSTEHGPLGGDEVNVIRKGANYGWPVASFGREYDGGVIGDGLTNKDGFEAPVYHHSTSTALSGAQFYSGNAFPRWRGHLFVGAMATRYLGRIIFDTGRAPREERLLTEQRWRVRVVRQGSDGFLYLGIDQSGASVANGMIVRLRPSTP
jgi:glucose/arabinose dehydrogenase